MELFEFSKDIQFVVNHYSDNYSYAFERYLFNEPRFYQSRALERDLSFYILHPQKQILLGRIRFSIEDQNAYSLAQSPFGGLEINEDLRPALLDDFLWFIEKCLKAKGIKTIKIKQFPFVYAEVSSSKITSTYLRKGYKVTHPDINHHIVVDSTSFVDKIHPMERRKIKKAINESFIFREESLNSLDRIYDFIQSCRAQKGQNLNTALVDLQTTVNAMPEDYKIFTVYDGDKIIACSIVVIVNKRIAYNFLPASSAKYKKYSPMVFLLAEIYAYCNSYNLQVFDLGISAVDNRLQSSLIDFKERVGGVAGLKLTFEKDI